MTTTIEIPAGTNVLNVTKESNRILLEFVPKFKEGDFVYEDGRIMIVHKCPHFYKVLAGPWSYSSAQYNSRYGVPFSSPSFRFATEEEKKILLDALEREGKKWNAEKLCIEDIPQRKFKPGDKVKVKDEMLYKEEESPYFVTEMHGFIGKVLTIKSYSSAGYIYLNEATGWIFAEDWLELYSDKPEKGDLAIFWDYDKKYSKIGICEINHPGNYVDHTGTPWLNAIKFESKEQFEDFLKK